jgi:signal transduction histidine kinase
VAKLRLHHRIVIPFAIVAIVATVAAAFVTLSVTSSALQQRLRAQLGSAAGVISRGDLALNPIILRNLHEIIHAHIVTVDASGRVVASSADASQQVLRVAIDAVASGKDSVDDSSPAQFVESDCGVPCVVAVKQVIGRPGYHIALVSETSELTAATSAVARTILLTGAVSIIVMVLVSQFLVRRVTAPLDRLVAFTRDLAPTNRKQRAQVGHDEVGALAQAFNDMLTRLEQAQESLVKSEKLALAGLIAARVAHDIRNPLSSIKMQTQMLRARAGADPEDQESLTAVLHDIEQVESVIRDLLELARPGELRPQFRHRKISVQTDLALDLPDVALDRPRFKQALLNVLVNASDAMPTGGVIAIASRAPVPGEVLLEVCDDGVGVDPATLPHVFDPFVSTKPDGVGLGLVNAKAVVEAHGGRIELAARAPKGTCVSIWLPVTHHG